MQWMWKQCVHCPHTSGQSSPGSLQSGQQPSKATRQMPHVSSFATHFHVQTPFHARRCTRSLDLADEEDEEDPDEAAAPPRDARDAWLLPPLFPDLASPRGSLLPIPPGAADCDDGGCEDDDDDGGRFSCCDRGGVDDAEEDMADETDADGADQALGPLPASPGPRCDHSYGQS